MRGRSRRAGSPVRWPAGIGENRSKQFGRCLPPRGGRRPGPRGAPPRRRETGRARPGVRRRQGQERDEAERRRPELRDVGGTSRGGVLAGREGDRDEGSHEDHRERGDGKQHRVRLEKTDHGGNEGEDRRRGPGQEEEKIQVEGPADGERGHPADPRGTPSDSGGSAGPPLRNDAGARPASEANPAPTGAASITARGRRTRCRARSGSAGLRRPRQRRSSRKPPSPGSSVGPSEALPVARRPAAARAP